MKGLDLQVMSLVNYYVFFTLLYESYFLLSLALKQDILCKLLLYYYTFYLGYYFVFRQYDRVPSKVLLFLGEGFTPISYPSLDIQLSKQFS